MKKTVLVLMALTGAVIAAQPSALTPEQTLERRTLGELDLSPDGARLVFTVTEPVKGTARQRNIWMLDVASGRVRQLTFSAKSDSAPRWAPDGRSIAFLSDRDGGAQLYLLPMSGGALLPLRIAWPENSADVVQAILRDRSEGWTPSSRYLRRRVGRHAPRRFNGQPICAESASSREHTTSAHGWPPAAPPHRRRARSAVGQVHGS
jgi:hypothetical protein